jgi:hypothetical protein
MKKAKKSTQVRMHIGEIETWHNFKKVGKFHLKEEKWQLSSEGNNDNNTNLEKTQNTRFTKIKIKNPVVLV